MMLKLRCKIMFFALLVSSHAFSQTVKTYPTGYVSLKSSLVLSPDYSEAILQAKKLVGSIFLEDFNKGTAYLFYNTLQSQWEVHTAYHIVKDAIEESLALIFKGDDKVELQLDPDQIVSTEDEHTIMDRARYKVTFNQTPPDKIIFGGEIEQGSSLISMGHPEGLETIKLSYGHALKREQNNKLLPNNKKLWLSTNTSQKGKSGSPTFELASNGQLRISGTFVMGKNFSSIMAIAYKINQRLSITVFSQHDFNQWINWISNQSQPIESVTWDCGLYFLEKFLPFTDKVTQYPSDIGAWYQFDQEKVFNALESILVETQQIVQDDPKQAVITMMEKIETHYKASKDHPSYINVIDFPMLTLDQIQMIDDEELKIILEREIEQSIANITIFKHRLDAIEALFKVGKLSQVIKNIWSLDIQNNEDNFAQYNIPTLSLISSY